MKIIVAAAVRPPGHSFPRGTPAVDFKADGLVTAPWHRPPSSSWALSHLNLIGDFVDELPGDRARYCSALPTQANFAVEKSTDPVANSIRQAAGHSDPFRPTPFPTLTPTFSRSINARRSELPPFSKTTIVVVFLWAGVEGRLAPCRGRLLH